MQSAVLEKLNEYLSYFAALKEAGLLILENARKQKEVEKILWQNNFQKAENWMEILNNLEQEKSVYIILDGQLEKELYDLIVQYSDRAGMIQIMDKKIMELRTVKFNPLKAHLVVIATRDNLKTIEKEFLIRDKVGLTEVI